MKRSTWFRPLVLSSAFLVACSLFVACTSDDADAPGGTEPGTDAGVSRGAAPSVDGASSAPTTSPDASSYDATIYDASTPDAYGDGAPELVLDTEEAPPGPTHRDVSWFVSQGKVFIWENPLTNDHYVVVAAGATPQNPASHGQVIQDVPVGPRIDSVAFDDTYIYEAVHGDVPGAAAQLARKKLDGSEDQGAATKYFSLPADLFWQDIAIANDAIYLVGAMATGSADDTASIYRIPLPIAATTALPTAIITGRKNTIADLTVVGTHLFWNELFGGGDWRLVTAETTGGEPVEMDPNLVSMAASIASDGTYVYWTTIGPTGELKRCPLTNLDPAHVLHVADVAIAQEGIVVKGQFVYAMERDHRTAYRIDVTNGSKQPLGDMNIQVPLELGIGIVGVDGNYLHVVSQDAKVWRFPNVQ